MPLRLMLSVLTLGLIVGISAGCSSADDAAPATGGGGKRKALSPEAARLGATMVKAVSSAEGNNALEVKFEVTQRPEVGKSVDVNVAFIPTAQLDRLYARFQATDGLELVKGGETEQIARPVTGTPIMHTLTITPRRDGIFTINAIVLMDSQTESVSRNFSMPVIAGSGLPAWTPKQAVARSAP